jgi:hypothetical protein
MRSFASELIEFRGGNDTEKGYPAEKRGRKAGGPDPQRYGRPPADVIEITEACPELVLAFF